MIKRLLRLIYEGKTIYEIAKILKMDYSAVDGMIKHLVKLGYLEERKRDGKELSFCSKCPLRKFCAERGFNVYYLTEKGKRVLLASKSEIEKEKS